MTNSCTCDLGCWLVAKVALPAIVQRDVGSIPTEDDYLCNSHIINLSRRVY